MSEMSFISLHDILSKPEFELGFILHIISTIYSVVVRVKLNSTSHGLPKYESYDLLLATSIFPARHRLICEILIEFVSYQILIRTHFIIDTGYVREFIISFTLV